MLNTNWGCGGNIRADGTIDISLCNIDPYRQGDVSLRLRGLGRDLKVSGRVLKHADMNAHNTFEQTEAVKPQMFDGITNVSEGVLMAALPPMSVVVLTLT
nr:alpha-L-arabinofuranosidase C-terminal domain-containing protein [Paenibacillus crassostreae]